jgi:oligopeptide/dipeptide ABC transporter ATP-binding protein
MKDQNLLEIQNLSIQFPSGGAYAKAVNEVTFAIHKGETLGIVGESGCGKSVTLFSILRLLPPMAKVSGEIYFDNRDMLNIPIKDIRKIRGKEISMIFQEPMTSLNPVFKIGDQINEAIMLHEKIGRKEATEKTLSLMRLVEISDPESRISCYPYQLSGGMRQRVMIALALSCKPKILLADEPTTALDVTIQAQILDLMQRLKQEYGMSIVIVTHDMGVIAEIAKRVLVYYAGRIVEEADTMSLFDNPTHPYTKGLLGCIPRINVRKNRLNVIKGVIPDILSLPKGCPFHPRCDYATAICYKKEPKLVSLSDNHKVACHLHNNYA